MVTSVGKCAKYVRWALEAGGMNTWGAAKIDQRPTLQKIMVRFYYIKVLKKYL